MLFILCMDGLNQSQQCWLIEIEKKSEMEKERHQDTGKERHQDTGKERQSGEMAENARGCHPDASGHALNRLQGYNPKDWQRCVTGALKWKRKKRIRKERFQLAFIILCSMMTIPNGIARTDDRKNPHTKQKNQIYVTRNRTAH